MKQFLTLFLTALGFWTLGQTVQTRTMSFERKAVVVPGQTGADYAPKLQCIEKPVPGGVSEKQPPYFKKSQPVIQRAQSTTLPPMVLGKGIYANPFANGTPNDNDLAISNGGKIISVINSTLYFYDLVGDSMLANPSFSTFTSSLGMPHQEFDPKVVYDPTEDRFVVLALNGYTDTTSSIILGFSQTNDPMGAWNLYALPGNPLNNGLWTDYPMFSLTDKELFVTVNLLYPDSSWQTGFVETIVWQLKKMDGFNGNSLTTVLHNNITWNGRPVRNLCPARGGSGNYGPNMYFVSNRNFQTQSDTFFLVEATDTIGAAGFAMNVTQLNSSDNYFLAGDARQTGVHRFATNDSRILGAVYENDKIQFVQNCLDTTSGFTAFYHGTISNVSTAPVVSGQIVSDTLLDLGYPGIAYAGNGPGDDAVVIGFDHTAPTVYAGCSAIKCDGNGNYTPILKAIDGTSYVNLLSDNTERWGDYFGIQRKYNNPGEVWIAGYYAYYSSFTRKHRAYIAQIISDSIDFSSVTETKPELSDAVVYPNPAVDVVTLEFTLNKAHYLNFTIYDMQGRKVITLMREFVKPGKNQFSFRADALTPGLYVLRVEHQGEVMFTKKVVRK